MYLKSTFHGILLVFGRLGPFVYTIQHPCLACICVEFAVLEPKTSKAMIQETTGMEGQNITGMGVTSVPSWIYLCGTREDAVAFTHSAIIFPALC